MAINQSEHVYLMFSRFLICFANLYKSLSCMRSMFQTLHVHVITEVLYNCKLLPVHRVLCRNYKYYKIDCITEKYCIRFYVQIIVGKVIKSGRC